MPHKRNPKVAERICGLARVVRGFALVGLENIPLWHERDISQSSAERVAIPDAFLALDYMLDRFVWIVDGLVVYPERMRRNLDASHNLFFSHRLLLALVEAGLPRDQAYRLVQDDAMRAWDEERDFIELVRADAEIGRHLDAAALDQVFDLAATVRHVDTVFERLSALVGREEPVHV
jgi:adenylosuccinate lyase